MGLVADHQVKMPAGEKLPLIVPDGIDAAHHGLIGGEHAPGGIVVLFLAQIGHGKVRQQIHKAALCLGNQAVSVGKEQNILHPPLLQQHLAQGDHRPGLPGAGGHDQQDLSAVLRQGVTGRPDGGFLIIAPGDFAVHQDVFQTGAGALQDEQLFQVPLGVNGGDLPLRVAPIVNVGLEPIGQEDHRAAALLPFDKVGVELCLLAALGHIHTGTLCLDDGKDPAIIPIEHIVGVTGLALVRHTGQLNFIAPVLALDPACILQHGIDVDFPGLVFGDVQRLWHIGLLPLRPKGGKILFQRFVLVHQLLNIDVGVGDEGDGLLGRQLQQFPVKLPFGVLFRIAIGNKIQKIEEIFQAQLRLLFGYFLAFVGSVVAHFADEIHAQPQIILHDIPKFLGIHQRDQLIIPGKRQLLVHGVHPLDRKLHGPPAAEHTGIPIDVQQIFSSHSHGGKGCKIGFR